MISKKVLVRMCYIIYVFLSKIGEEALTFIFILKSMLLPWHGVFVSFGLYQNFQPIKPSFLFRTTILLNTCTLYYLHYEVLKGKDPKKEFLVVKVGVVAAIKDHHYE